MGKMISADVAKDATNLDGFLESIPNIKKLDILCRLTSVVIDLSHLRKLEILACSAWLYLPRTDYDLFCRFKVIFPCNIKKLYLSCGLHLGLLRSLRSTLHKLEVLKITRCTFKSKEETCEEEWELAEEDVFSSLQFLYLEGARIMRWIADETNFPKLHHLSFIDSWFLEEIPSGIGEIPTLQLIYLENCSKFAVASAERIVEEQSENGNYFLQLLVV